MYILHLIYNFIFCLIITLLRQNINLSILNKSRLVLVLFVYYNIVIERGRTSCTFDMGMSLLNALGVSVIIENNQIYLKDGNNMNMNNTKYERKDLEFVTFNIQYAYELHKQTIKKEEDIASKEYSQAFEKLNNSGYEVHCSRLFNLRLWDADHYPADESLVTISKGEREIAIISSGCIDIDFFLFEEFIKDIKEKYPLEGAFIEKVLLFECINNDKGNDVYHIFKHKGNILYISNLLDDYEYIIEETLSAKNYFYEVVEEYDPRCLTISDMLGIYDCSSSAYPYYVFNMPDGERVIAEDSFEGHSISEALNYAIAYFEQDYDRYIDIYNEDEDYLRRI